MRRIAILVTAAAVLGAAPAASASEPAAGHLAEDRLQQKWTGEAYGQPFKFGAYARTRCDAPFCDSFSLDVRATGQLSITVNVPDSASYVDVEVTLPDGTTEFFEGNGEDTSAKIVYDDAALGTYVIRTWPNKLPLLYEPAYSGVAKLVLPPPLPPATEG